MPAFATSGPTAFPFADSDIVASTSGGDSYILIGQTAGPNLDFCGAYTPFFGHVWIPYVSLGDPDVDVAGTCADGDLLYGDTNLNGPGAWADPGIGLWAPTITFLGGKYHVYYGGHSKGGTYNGFPTAKGQVCIGHLESTTSSALSDYIDDGIEYCGSLVGGRWALDPSVLHVGTKQYLAFRDDSAASYETCDTAISVAQLDTTTGTMKLPTLHPLLRSNDMSWEDFVEAGPCPTGMAKIIENPSLVKSRATFYLFFSGNAWASNNYATGIADCGTDLLTATCTMVGSKRKPYFGSSLADTGQQPLHQLPGNDPGPGAMSVFRTVAGETRVLWKVWHLVGESGNHSPIYEGTLTHAAGIWAVT